MKKIVTALTMGAIVAGSAFADFKVSANYRQRANVYTQAGGEGYAAVKTAGWLDKYNGNGSDNISLKMVGDIVTFDFLAVNDQATDGRIRLKNVDAEVKLGKVTLFGGHVSDGKSNGAYRVKGDADAGAFEGPDFEYKKLGSIYAKSPSLFVDNPLQNVAGAGDNLALSAKYGLDLGDNSIDISGWYISNESSGTKNEAEKAPTTFSKHTGVLLADGNFGFGKAEFVFKVGDYGTKNADKEENTAMAFGLYVQPTIMPGLTLTVGANGSTVDGKFTDWGMDLRARYVSGALSVSFFNALSGLTDDGVENLSGYAATKGLAMYGGNAVNDGQFKGTAPANSTMIMSNTLLARYKLNDKIAVTGIFSDMITLGDTPVKGGDNKDVDANIDIRAGLWCQFYAAPKAFIHVGLVDMVSNVSDANDGKSYNAFCIPVIFRVCM